MSMRTVPGAESTWRCCSKKSITSDEGRQRQAALLAFSAFPELKNIFLVDEDVMTIPERDVSCKTILDCTVPFAQKERFKRAEFLEVDYRNWL